MVQVASPAHHEHVQGLDMLTDVKIIIQVTFIYIVLYTDYRHTYCVKAAVQC